MRINIEFKVTTSTGDVILEVNQPVPEEPSQLRWAEILYPLYTETTLQTFEYPYQFLPSHASLIEPQYTF